MILYGFVAGLMVLAVIFALLSVLSGSAEKFLWGTALASLFLGMAFQLSAGGYWGFLALAGFLITDLIVYLGLRSIGFVTKDSVQHPNFEKMFRVFFLWVALTLFSFFFYCLFFMDSFSWLRELPAVGSPNLAEVLWDNHWLLIVVAMASTITSVVGGYFLVRKELRRDAS